MSTKADTGIQSLLDEVAMTDDTIVSTLSNLEVLKHHASIKTAAIRELILNGDTTGDILRDYTIVTYRSTRSVWYDALKELSDKLAAHAGQLMLLIERDFVRTRFGGSHDHSARDYHATVENFFGIIRVPGIVFPDFRKEEQYMTITVEKFVSVGRSGYKVLAEDLGSEHVRIGLGRFKSANKLPLDGSILHEGKMQLEIIVGDSAVREHASREHVRRRDQISRLLGRSLEVESA
ncbi:MAG: hypothetical protein JWN50_155 [Parcubacteria group bacterium]|nr:hypothetical protein [Parcubacteria group bacterium]